MLSSYCSDDVQAAGVAPNTLAGITIEYGRISSENAEASLYDGDGNIIKVLDPISSEWKDSFKRTTTGYPASERIIVSRTDFEKMKSGTVRVKFAGNVDNDECIHVGNEPLETFSGREKLYKASSAPDFDYEKAIFGNEPADPDTLEQFYMDDGAFIGEEFGDYSKKVFEFGQIKVLSMDYFKINVNWIGTPAEYAEVKFRYQLKEDVIINAPIEPFDDAVIREMPHIVRAEDDWEWIILWNNDPYLADENIANIPEKYWKMAELYKGKNKYSYITTNINEIQYHIAYHAAEGMPIDGYVLSGPENRGFKEGEYTDSGKNKYEITYSKIEEPSSDLELDRENHKKYMNGYPEGIFGPERNITREETAQMFYNLLTALSLEKYKGSEHSFPDVSSSDWSAEAIAVLSKGKVINGYPDGTFKPRNPITRAEFATMAAKFERLAKTNINPFSDIENHWAFDTIKSAALNGWINGYSDGTFQPDKYITRAEAVKLVNGILDREIHEENIPVWAKQWPDVPAAAWYYTDIIEATNDHKYDRLGDGSETWQPFS